MTTQAPTVEQVRTAWDNLAAGYDAHTTPLNTPLAEDALRRAGVRSEMRVLDVASGTGALGLAAARLGARVVATDLSPAMIEHLTARADAEGLTDVEGRVMDGSALDIEDDAFDVAGSQHGVSLFPDVTGGLRELVRVTRPGGRTLVVAFGALEKAEFLGWFLAALRAAVPGFVGPPTDPPPPAFQLADPDRLRREMTEAGLADVRVETVTHPHEFASAQHFWDAITVINPIAAALTADLTPEQGTEVRNVLDGMLRERSGGAPGAVLSVEINIGIGRK